jgi:hypothetical protein
MKSNIYLKIAGIIFLSIGTMELLEQKRVSKEKQKTKIKGESEEHSAEMRIPHFRKLEPLVRMVENNV